MLNLELITIFALSFLLGSLPFGLLISKYWLGLDIREHGSGNIGMTNVVRVGGKLPGILTFVLDFAKGSLAVWGANLWLSGIEHDPDLLVTQLSLVGGVVIFGHVFSIFLRFKGGKGISTTFGVLAILHFQVALVAAVIWIGTFLARRISSLSALTMLGMLPFLFLIIPVTQGQEIHVPQFFIFSGITALLIYRHRENIHRIFHGAEKPLQNNNTNEV